MPALSQSAAAPSRLPSLRYLRRPRGDRARDRRGRAHHPGGRAGVERWGRGRRPRRSRSMGAGPSGATRAAATFALRRIHGVRRPALALQLLVPGRDGPPTLLLDVGANAEVRAIDLVQFAFLGSAFSRAVLGVDRPRVALLS